MRVLHVINSLALGGAERLLSDLLPELAALGIDCGVLVLDARGDVFSVGLRKAGVTVIFARDGGASPFAPARLLDIRKVIKREQPDIVHAHLGPSFHWCALASPASRSHALVATEHASVNRRMELPVLRKFEEFCYGRYDAVACVSGDAANAIHSWLGVAGDRLPVIANGIALERFAGAVPAADVVEALAGRTGVAMVARFVPVKGHQTALDALALLHPDHVLVMAGDGPDRAAVESRARERGVAERCLFLGGRNDVPAVLAACRCYLQTSSAEGFGIAALEAMASGLPVVASDVPGLSTLVDGAGRLFPLGDAVACAREVRLLCQEGAAREACLTAGHARAASYSIRSSARAYARLYEKILSERTGA